MKTQTTLRLALASALLLGASPLTQAELIHRYSFTTDVSDSVGTAHGTAAQLRDGVGPVGTAVVFQDGQAVLDGTGGYIDLPNGLVSSLTNMTIEGWVTWGGGGNWQRIFDFGSNDTGEDTDGSKRPGTGFDYVFLTPRSGAAPNTMRFAITDDSGGQERPVLNDTFPFEAGVQVHVAVTYGPGGARLFYNGIQAAAGNVEIPLSAVQDVNVWLGRANWPDPIFTGSFNEFRVHNSILDSQALVASTMAGPDTVNYDPGAISLLTMTLRNAMLVGEVQTPQLRGTFANVGEVALVGSDVVLSSSNTNVVEITAAGLVQAKAAGSAIVTASLGGQNATVNITVAAGAPELKHRYSFSEAEGATTAVDSVGGFNGTAYAGRDGTNAVLFGNGQATFRNANSYTNGAYIDLPDFMISAKTNLTVETWFTWNGPANANNTRIFDFGDSLKGSDPYNAGNGVGYLFLAPRGTAGIRFTARTNAAAAEVPNLLGPQLPVGQEVHVALVYAPAMRFSRLYVNGVPVASGDAVYALNQFNDVNNWIGQSQWNDPPLNAAINEFRIYEGALSDLDIALSRKAGPDALGATPGALQTLAFGVAPQLYLGNPTGYQVALLANFANVTGVDVAGVSGVSYVSGNTNIFTVNATGALTPRALGSASLVATYQSLSATTTVSVVAPIAIRVTLPETLVAGSLPVTPTILADFPNNATNINIATFAGLTNVSSDPLVFSIAANGQVIPQRGGSATLTATYSGISGQATTTVILPPNFKQGELKHRYSFSEAAGATNVTDSVGGANGEVVKAGDAADFTGTGELNVVGGAFNAAPLPTYVNLPNGLVSGLGSMTLEGWVTWNGPVGQSWQRILDFGRTSAVDGGGLPVEDTFANPGVGYMFLSPRSGNNTTRFTIKQGTGAETPVLDTAPMVVGAQTHFAIVYDVPAAAAHLYINGVRAVSGAVTLPLSVVEDINVYLGRSAWTDSFFNGRYNEFRIYDGVLAGADIAATFAAGPDALPDTNPDPTPSITVGLVGGNVELSWPATATGFVLETSATLGTTASWTAVATTPTEADGVKKVTLTPASGTAFFRLKR